MEHASDTRQAQENVRWVLVSKPTGCGTIPLDHEVWPDLDFLS